MDRLAIGTLERDCRRLAFARMFHPLPATNSKAGRRAILSRTIRGATENNGIHHFRTVRDIRTDHGYHAAAGPDSVYTGTVPLLDRGHATHDPMDSPCPLSA